jgi:glyoxylase I family protein
METAGPHRRETEMADRPPAGAASPFASWKVEHAGIRVPDFQVALSWYREKLDFRLTRSLTLGGLTFGFVMPPADECFSFELLAGPGADDRPAYEDLHASYRLAGWHHICFRVDNVDEAIEALKRRGVTIVSEPHDVPAIGRRVAFFADPWGNLFEVIRTLGQGAAGA